MATLLWSLPGFIIIHHMYLLTVATLPPQLGGERELIDCSNSWPATMTWVVPPDFVNPSDVSDLGTEHDGGRTHC